MREVQIIVVNPNSGNYERLELFKDETILLTQTIQNARDIGSIFTDFSQSFTLPASKSNNILFEFYYNSDIETGFNANDKRSAQILLNGSLFRKGFLALDGVELKQNNPFSYKVTFFGETVDIKKQLKDLTLRNLFEAYTALNHTYDVSTVSQGLVTSLFNGKICYPLISHTERYFYDSSTHANGTRNLHYAGSGASQNQGVNFRDLKPAIKINEIFKRINETTDLQFDLTTGFLATSNPDFQQLFLWLSRERGSLGQSYTGGQLFQLNVNSITNFFADGGNLGGFVPPLTIFQGQVATRTEIVCSIDNGIINMSPLASGNFQNQFGDRQLRLDWTVTSTSTYSLYMIDTLTNNVVSSRESVTGAQSIAFELEPLTFFDPSPVAAIQLRIETEDGTFVASAMSLRIKYEYFLNNQLRRTYSKSTTLAPTALVNDIDVALQMPSIKVLDFLTGMFKMFNLTAFFQQDNTIAVQTLDSYYNGGVQRDITDYVDVDKKNVNYPIPYQEIAFRYEKPKTFLAINFEEINGYQFGNLENTTQNQGVTQTDRGKKYVVKLPFEKMIYEPLFDQNGATAQNILYGYTVDKDQNPVAVMPLIFYRRNTNSINGYSIQNLGGSNQAAQRQTYNRPSNSYFQKTLNFNAEVDEFTGLVKPQSLFNNYYRNYISSLFSRQRRLVKITAYLPLSFLLEYSLKDVFIVNGRLYNVNSIKTNLQDGKSEIEMYNKIEIS